MKDNTKALILGISPLASLFFGFAFCNVIFPLIFWLIWKDESKDLDNLGRRILNFQISWLIWIAGGSALLFLPSLLLFGIPSLLYLCVSVLVCFVYSIIFVISIANGNYAPKVPFVISFLSLNPTPTPVEPEIVTDKAEKEEIHHQEVTEEPVQDAEVITPEIIEEEIIPPSEEKKND